MSGSRLVLITPRIVDADAFAETLRSACAGGDIAALILPLATAAERDLINAVKLLAPIGQAAGAAVLVAGDGFDLPSVSIRGGADGIHVDGAAAVVAQRDKVGEGRILGAGDLRSRHDAMEAGEAAADYVMFGEPRADGSTPPFSAIVERAAWWAAIFETPCVAYAAALDHVAELAGTGAEFVALGEAVWNHKEGPKAAVSTALTALAAPAVA